MGIPRRFVIVSALVAVLAGTSVSIVGEARADALADGHAAWDRGEFEKSMSILMPLAEAGVAQAQFTVGIMYWNAQGVPENAPEAVKWFLLAADQGLADAYYSLGQQYSLGGGGMERNREEAYFWLVLAIEGYEKEGGRSDTLDSARQMRDLVAGRLTPEQIAAADKRVADWKAAH
jgi:TPR repeat protein